MRKKARVAGAVALLLALAAVLGRFGYPTVDIAKERALVEARVCYQPQLADASAVLDAMRFDSYVDPSRNRLRASRSFVGTKVMYPIVFVEVTFDSSDRITSCRVESFYLGRN
jgi:hypothetical protein